MPTFTVATLRHIQLSAILAAVSLSAGAASAAITTTPILSAPTIGGNALSGVNLSFSGFDTAFKTANSIPLNAVLNTITITLSGTTGGSVAMTNFVPAPTSAFIQSPGTFTLTVNGITATPQNNPNNAPSIPGATTAPYVPGSGPVGITPQSKTFVFGIVPGGTSDVSYFYFNSPVSLSSLSDYTVSIYPGAASEGSWNGTTLLNGDFSTFAISPTLTNSYLTYNWSVPASTPGPLPVLGAASAFGFSRRLRRKVKLVS